MYLYLYILAVDDMLWYFVCVCVYVCVYMYVCVYILFVCVCMYECVCMYIYIYVGQFPRKWAFAIYI